MRYYYVYCFRKLIRIVPTNIFTGHLDKINCKTLWKPKVLLFLGTLCSDYEIMCSSLKNIAITTCPE